jgi:serine/threonine protein kinase
MCNYSFPDSIQISKTAKNFISKMLQLEPSKRLTVDEILGHEFFSNNPFPKSLPISCLACPPNANFMKKFQVTRDSSLDNRDPVKKLDSNDKMNTSRGYDMANTDRVQSLNREKLLSTRTST